MAAHAEQPFDLGQTGKMLYAGDLAKRDRFTRVDGRWVARFGLPEEYA